MAEQRKGSVPLGGDRVTQRYSLALRGEALQRCKSAVQRSAPRRKGTE
nr:MAG TPA: hypothetical protein [Caudoviricetes sp.]